MIKQTPASFARRMHRQGGYHADHVIRAMLAGNRSPADRSFLLRALGELQMLRLTERHPSF